MGIRIRSPRRAVMAAFTLNGAVLGTWGTRVPAVMEFHGLTEAAVKGSGAGMDPGPGAVLVEDWWVWAPDLPAVPDLILAASGETGGGWRLCDGAICHEIGAGPGAAIRLAPCDGPADARP